MDTNDTEASFASTAGRQLLVFFVSALVLLALAMWGLQVLASMVGADSGAAKAIDRGANTISIAIREEPPQLNSTKATDSSSGMVLGHTMEGLLRMNLNDQLEAAIAERWELTETHATFWLREDAKWSDGVTITAHDFIFAWRTALLPETASEYAFLLYPIKNESFGTGLREYLVVSFPMSPRTYR